MDSRVLTLAERIIGRSDREHPADSLLRLDAKSQRDLSRKDSSILSRCVFSYFRWRGWLQPEQTLRDQIQHALGLAEQFAKHPASFSDNDLVARSVPAWIQGEIEITAALARAFQTEPQLWLRARPGQGKVLAKQLGHCRAFGPGPLADTLAYHGSEDLFRTKPFQAGDFELQDISSQAVGLVCAPIPGEVWWDVCAGEGGKTLHLSGLMNNRGLIWATDRAEWRLSLLKRRAARAKVFNYRAAIWNGGSKLPTKTRFDGVLVDAPCSGTGTWQRNPHARWTLTCEDLSELSELQLKLLVHAAKGVKPGGRLLYSVCSMALSETIRVVESFEKQCSGFKLLPLLNPLDPGSGPQNTILFWPQQFGGNGMFIAAWESGSGD